MMDVRELRIGNYVLQTDIDENQSVIEISPYDIYESYQETIDIKPIQITEECLLKFGFEKSFDGDYWVDKNTGWFMLIESMDITN